MIITSPLTNCQQLILHRPQLVRTHLASRLVPCFTTVPRFTSRRSTVSARPATIPLNAASPDGIPFACMTAAAISADVSGPDAIRKASCVSLDSSLRAMMFMSHEINHHLWDRNCDLRRRIVH
jgi:hypothetical protein